MILVDDSLSKDLFNSVVSYCTKINETKSDRTKPNQTSLPQPGLPSAFLISARRNQIPLSSPSGYPRILPRVRENCLRIVLSVRPDIPQSQGLLVFTSVYPPPAVNGALNIPNARYVFIQ